MKLRLLLLGSGLVALAGVAVSIPVVLGATGGAWFGLAGVAALGGSAIGFALGRGNSLLRQAFLVSSAPMLISEDDLTPVRGNPAFEALMRFPEPAPGEETAVSAPSPSSLAADPESGARLGLMAVGAAAGKGMIEEMPLSFPGIGRRWWRVQALPLAEEGRYLLWRFEAADERRGVEEIMRGEQERLAELVENAPIGLYSVDAEGYFLYVNPAFAGWIGMTAAEILDSGMRLHDLLPLARGLPPWSAVDPDLPAGEVVMRTPDGRPLRLAVLQSAASGTGVDLRAVAALREVGNGQTWPAPSERSPVAFRQFFEDAPVGVALLRADGCLAEANPALLALLGLGQRQVEGIDALLLFDAGDRGGVRTMLERVRAGEQENEARIEVRLEAGGGLPVALYARRVRGENGEVSGDGALVLHFIDASERRALEQQFVQSQKMQAVGQLAGGVAHDFNNLLTAISGFCDLLLQRHLPGDRSFADIMQIKQNSNRAANLVRQLLAFSRQQTLKPRVLDLTEVVAEIANLIRRLIGENIALEIHHGRDLGLVRADQGQLEQVIINLAVNARDAMPGGGTLSLATAALSLLTPRRTGSETVPRGDYVVLSVRDTGTGILPEYLGRIFDPFFTTKPAGAGTGLGLSTVYGILRQTGGYITATSAPGEGAEFTIYLPRHEGGAQEEASVAAAAEEARSVDLTGTGTILLAEDEDAVRTFGARALRNKGYTVLVARDGEEALELLRSPEGEAVELLISDVVMPGIDGPSLVRAILPQRPALKVIFISGYAEDRLRASDAGDVAAEATFLPKPFSLKQLTVAVKKLLT